MTTANVQGGFHKRWSRTTWSARQVAKRMHDDLELSVMESRPRVVPVTYVGELPTDGAGTFILALENKQRFRVTVKEIDSRGHVGPRPRAERAADHCGCCGRPTVGDWCTDCQAHLAPDDGRPPWTRTWYAQHNTACPFA